MWKLGKATPHRRFLAATGNSRIRRSYTLSTSVTRDAFNELVLRNGGFRIRVRLLSTDDGGRQTPISGDSEYRLNWSIESNDPSGQAGGPTLIDADKLRPGEEGTAVLIPFLAEAWESVQVGTSLTGFEGSRVVARAVVLEPIAGESEDAME